MRVLLVDDHMDGLEITARLLKLEGFEVLTAGMCADALRLAQQSPIDLVVTDLGLPDGTGMDLMHRLHELYRVPGVAMTAHGESWYLEGAKDRLFVRHLLKPFVFSDLLAAVREALGPGAAPREPRPAREPASPPTA